MKKENHKTSIRLFAKKDSQLRRSKKSPVNAAFRRALLFFKSKEALLLSACEYYIGMSMNKMKNIEEDLAGKPPKKC